MIENRNPISMLRDMITSMVNGVEVSGMMCIFGKNLCDKAARYDLLS